MANTMKRDVLDDIFEGQEAVVQKIKADLLDTILDEVKRKEYTQAALVLILNTAQPNVSNLLRGNIHKISIEKLLTYVNQMQIPLKVEVKTAKRKRALATA